MPKVTSETEALAILSAANVFAFYLRVQRGGPTGSSSSSPKALQIIQEQTFRPEDYYAWFYEGSQWTTYAGGILMVAVILAGVMFPLWPPILRLGAWYISMGMLGLIGLFFAIAIVRLIFYIITVIVASPGIWIFPQLFADVGFVSSLSFLILWFCPTRSWQVDSFIPSWEWDIPKKKSKKKKNEKGEKEKGKKNGTITTEEVADSSEASQQPVRGARIEEVPDEDAWARCFRLILFTFIPSYRRSFLPRGNRRVKLARKSLPVSSSLPAMYQPSLLSVPYQYASPKSIILCSLQSFLPHEWSG